MQSPSPVWGNAVTTFPTVPYPGTVRGSWPGMGNWRYLLAGMSSQDRARAVRAFQAAADALAGTEGQTATAALQTGAAAEGLCPTHRWIDAAAVELSRARHRRRRPAFHDGAGRAALTRTGSARGLRREGRLRDLLRSGGPAMVLQPIVELATGRVAGAEALARFPDATERSPEVWFADAAAAGLGVELELSAIRAALSMLDRLPPSTYLSVNASPATVVSEPLLELLTAAPTGRLVLELTEHVPVADYERLAGPLNRLRWRGVRLAVDDAGSGYSSQQHILNIAPDIIKVDAALVRDVDTDPARRSLAASLKMFADRTGAAVIAEGIETEQEHAALLRLHIGFGQGSYLGHPAPQLPQRLAGARTERRTG